jgi:glycosyltransferase involved in cell wall biosynthesis
MSERLSRSAEPSTLFISVFLAAPGFARPCADLASRLEDEGWTVIRSSWRTDRIERLLDMVLTVWRRRRDYTIARVEVFSGLAFIWAEAACLSLRAAGRPYILSLHGGRLPEFAKRWPGRVRRLLASGRAVVAPSHYLVETMKGYRNDIQLVPNALVLSDFPFRLRGPVAPRLVWVRSFHRIYNPSLAVRVLAALRADIPDVRLTMVGPDKGDGALEATRREIAELGLEGVVDFAGAVAHEEIAQYLAGADIFLNTTNIDNTPVSVLEAMASGLCVVSTNVGGLPFLLQDGRDALLVPPDDIAAMSAAVRRLLAEPELARRLSSEARHEAERFDWSFVMSQWKALLAEGM